jgi:hypothetical protein
MDCWGCTNFGAETQVTDGQITSCFQKRVKPSGAKYSSSVFQKYMIVLPHPASTRGAFGQSPQT